MPVLEIAGEHFRIQIDGAPTAPPLVLAHSLGTALEMFDPVIPALTQRFRVVRYDARGHGHSSAPDAVYPMGELGRDLLNILDRLNLGPMDLCGLSLGGMVGQWMALHAPQRLRRLVLANTTAYAGPPRVWDGRIKAVRHTGTAPIADAVIDSWFTPEFRARSPEAVATVRAMIVATPKAGYIGTSCGMRDMDFRAALPRITTPTLVIVSDADRATPPAWGEAIAAAIPAAKLVRLPGAHLSPIEQPERFAAAVTDFLA